MQPHLSSPLNLSGITISLIGFYTVLDPSASESLFVPKPSKLGCVFAFYKSWLKR